MNIGFLRSAGWVTLFVEIAVLTLPGAVAPVPFLASGSVANAVTYPTGGRGGVPNQAVQSGDELIGINP